MEVFQEESTNSPPIILRSDNYIPMAHEEHSPVVFHYHAPHHTKHLLSLFLKNSIDWEVSI